MPKMCIAQIHPFGGGAAAGARRADDKLAAPRCAACRRARERK